MRQQDRLRNIRNQLLAWYRKNARVLPWRESKDPYAIWVSEIMLQQTRVTAVIPYYERFLNRFPDVQSLARCRIGTVLKLWEGLGYYSRARNLHRAAKILVKQYGGKLPDTNKELRELPGIGRYTAGAIASIAFDRDEPVLDGNVSRVLCRLLCIKDDPRQSAVQERLWTMARDLIPTGKAGTFNQALMELGAMTCTPKKPQCSVCPVHENCRAYKKHIQEQIPFRATKTKIPHYTIAVGVVWKNGKILIDRRKPDSMLGGLWEFPGGKRQKNEPLTTTVQREVKEELDIQVKVGKLFLKVNHAYSHFRITLHAFHCEYVSGKPRAVGCDAWKWVKPTQLKSYAFPRANQMIIQALMELETDS